MILNGENFYVFVTSSRRKTAKTELAELKDYILD